MIDSLNIHLFDFHGHHFAIYSCLLQVISWSDQVSGKHCFRLDHKTIVKRIIVLAWQNAKPACPALARVPSERENKFDKNLTIEVGLGRDTAFRKEIKRMACFHSKKTDKCGKDRR